ncbi:MAG: hypothetical protein GX443_11990 [Deltaproteobacteria bacterium]|nr:hypothetical protein [Deltaproteobacteria bacterium]
MSATIEEIMAAYEGQYPGRVHRQSTVPFSGSFGHYYFLSIFPTFENLAQITDQSQRAEVTLFQINNAYVIYVGNPHYATATFAIPVRDPEHRIVSFRWIAHTHPLDAAHRDEMISHGPTQSDLDALRTISARWGQSDSQIILCRGGRVERTVSFSLPPDEQVRP